MESPALVDPRCDKPCGAVPCTKQLVGDLLDAKAFEDCRSHRGCLSWYNCDAGRGNPSDKPQRKEYKRFWDRRRTCPSGYLPREHVEHADNSARLDDTRQPHFNEVMKRPCW